MAWYDYLAGAVGGPVGYGISRAAHDEGFRDDAKNFLFGGNATKGMPSGPQSADFQRAFLKTFSQQPATMMDASQSDQTRGQQNQLAAMLFRQATGATPGAGELAVNRQVGAGMAQNTAAAQMARGANAALAARNAARANSDLAVNGAGQASIAQLQDQQAAQNQLGGLLGNMRQQDIGVAQGNQQAQFTMQGQQLQALAQLLGVDQVELPQDLARRGLKMQDKGMFPSLLQVGGQIGAAYAGGGVK